jgi:plasmid stability protein
MDTKPAILFVELPPSLKSAVQQLAHRNERSVAQEVRFILRRELEHRREVGPSGVSS